MKCKHCNAQVPEDVLYCPDCGKKLTKSAAVKSSKGLWFLGAALLGFQLLISSGSTNGGYVPFVDVTNWRVFLYDLTYFLFGNFIGVIGSILLLIAAIRTFRAKNTSVSETAAEETVAEEPAEETAEEQNEAPAKTSTRKTTAAVIALVLVAGILIGLIAGTMGNKPADTSLAAPTVPAETEPVVIPSNGDPASAMCKASYTVSDEQAAASSDVVVATMGDKTLTNGELQAFYWQEVYMFLTEYGNYAQYMGLDVYTGLDQQLMLGGSEDGTDLSWQQFFLDGAIATWKNYQALALEAEEADHQLPADMQAELDEMAADMEAAAVSGGFENADAMIRANVGAACSLESYMKYVNTYYQGMAYYSDYCSNLDPSDEEVEAFYAENEDYYTENGVTKDGKFVNVRHVLLQPEGGEADENGYPVYTEEAWEACRVKAEELYAQWQAGDMSEDSFAQLANEHTADVNDTDYDGVPDGGLYTDVSVGQMVQEFEDWCFDESRVPGDHGLVKTMYGYHIMYFSAHRSWFDLAKEGLIDSLAYDKIPETAEKYTAEVDFSLVELGALNFA